MICCDSENKILGEFSAVNGTFIFYTLLPKLKGHCGPGWKDWKSAEVDDYKETCFLDIARQLHIWVHSVRDTPMEAQGRQKGIGKWTWSPTLKWEAIGNWYVLEGQSVFFKGVAPRRWTMLCGRPHGQQCMGSTHWTRWAKKKKEGTKWNGKRKGVNRAGSEYDQIILDEIPRELVKKKSAGDFNALRIEKQKISKSQFILLL